jgi:hypothetical protein
VALALLAQLVEHLHGKEGVDGSSPSEGFWSKEIPGNRGFLLSGPAPQGTSRCRPDSLVGSPLDPKTARKMACCSASTEHLLDREGLLLRSSTASNVEPLNHANVGRPREDAGTRA